MAAILLPVQQSLTPPLPTIEGSVDYRHFRDQLLRIDQLLVQSGIEQSFISQTFELWKSRLKFTNIPAKAQLKFQIHARRALRCNLVRTLLMESYRDLAVRLADSPLLQHFCGLVELDRVQVPAKSTLQRYFQWGQEPTVRERVYQLMKEAHFHSAKLRLTKPLDLQAYFLDSTCVKANIHYPIDWVLLRDGTRTLMKAVKLIRAQGLRQRMEEPETFIKRMNNLCIKMTHTWGKSESKKQWKKVFRAIDKLVATVGQHAKRYREVLAEKWEQTEWTRGQTDYILRRLDNVLAQLPQARRQARRRIIQEQQVPSKEKILSLYEPDAQVIVRKKAGAEVEFGNTLLVGETPQGLIVDWLLFKGVAPNDARLVLPSVKRTQQNLEVKPGAVGADRGLDSQSNQQALKKMGIYNAICPRDPRQLKERQKSWKFAKLQRRRAQSEGRIGILKNDFCGCPLRSKGFGNRELAVTWAVLTHNLWVIARLPVRKIRKKAQLRAA